MNWSDLIFWQTCRNNWVVQIQPLQGWLTFLIFNQGFPPWLLKFNPSRVVKANTCFELLILFRCVEIGGGKQKN
jgi:hypothetical protein